MKTLFLSLALVSLAAPAAFAAPGAQASRPSTAAAGTASQGSKPAPAKHVGTKTHMVNAEFVGYDAATKMVTLRDANGQTSSAPAEGRAVAEVAHLKANQKVKVTCRDSATGEHEAITAIAAVKSKA